MAGGDFLQFFLEDVDVECRCQAKNRIGIDFRRHRGQDLLLVGFEQVRRQALGRGILLTLGADGVPADLHRHPFLGPVAAEPRNEIFFGQFIDPRTPVFHGATGVDSGLLGGRLRRGDDLPVHLLPGAGGNDDRRHFHRRTRRRGAPCQHHQHGNDQRTQVQDGGFLKCAPGGMSSTRKP
ncbi:hypothetical protein D3C75_902110 [compost metagenome]